MTLLEMLVTLVVVGLVAGILSQALLQLARIERLLEAGQVGAMADTVRVEWVRSMLSSLMPGAAARGERLVGSERELAALSADAPTARSPALGRISLRIAYQERSETTELSYVAPTVGDGVPVVLLAWPGREGRFRYLDAQGQWHDRWTSAAGSSSPALPAAIAVETGLAGAPWIVAAVRASETRLPTRRELEAL